MKKEDPVKHGLEELQRLLPHLGSPGEEKVWGKMKTNWPNYNGYKDFIRWFNLSSFYFIFYIIDKSSQYFVWNRQIHFKNEKISKGNGRWNNCCKT